MRHGLRLISLFTILLLLCELAFEAAARKHHETTTRRPTTTTEKDEGSSEESKESTEDEWACGTDDWTKLIAQSTIDRDCPKLKNAVNKCCVGHDTCYDDQRGKKFCDDTFCTCLQIATATSPVCNKEDGPTFCNLVREFGEEAYRASAKNVSSLPAADLLFPLTNTTLPEYDDDDDGRNATSTLGAVPAARKHGQRRPDKSHEARYRRQLRLNLPTKKPLT